MAVVLRRRMSINWRWPGRGFDPLFRRAAPSGGLQRRAGRIGAALLGFAAGATGTFLFLRKRALVSDAIAHATLPGVGLAFIIMVALGGDGRSLVGLLIGSAITPGSGFCRSSGSSRARA
jgi:manganese/zinc/iron transport system permease protein